MRKYLAIYLSILFLGGVILKTDGAWPSTTETILPVDEESIAGAPAPSTPLKKDRIWKIPRVLGWEHRFFDKPLAVLNFRKNQFRLPSASEIPLKAPGMFPGIEIGLEMHSFQALQSVVPPEGLAIPLSSKPNQPLFLSPFQNSPDYNAGFLRFTW